MSTSKPHKFGAFLGVYTPSILTILGLIMERVANSLKMVVFTQNNGMDNYIPVIFSLVKD